MSGYDRRGRDFYATPDWVTDALLQRVRFRGPIWEPCCGSGAMSTVLAAHGPTPYFVQIDRALRDEGTSHHYLPPSTFAEADPALAERAFSGA